MEGFWTVQFKGVQGFGGGVVTLIDGQVFGGDSTFIYNGTYTQNGNTLNARVHVKAFVPGGVSVMGLTEFDLEMNGSQQGNAITFVSVVSGTQMRLTGSMSRQRDLPPRA